jgi:diguanylate cyclase (GGDEF)-like protein
MAGTSVDEAANPVGVQAVCTAFNEAMQNLGLQRRARKSIYDAFEHALVGQLGELHAQLSATLVERGVLPKVERPLPSAPRHAHGGAREAAPPAAAPEPDAAALDASLAREPMAAGASPGPHGQPPPAWQAPGASAAAGYPAPPAGAASVPPGSDAPVPSAGPGGAVPAMSAALADLPQGPGAGAYHPVYQSPIHSPVAQVGMAQAYQAARSILGLQRAVSSGTPLAHAPRTAAPPAGGAAPSLMSAPSAGSVSPGPSSAPSAGSVSPGLMSALGNLQSAPEITAPQPHAAMKLKARLRQSLEREGIALGADEGEAVDVLADLIEAVLGDPLIHEAIKPRIQRLAVPLLRAALQDQGFFTQDANPARQVVNRLGMLGLPETLADGESGDSLVGSVDPLLERIVSDPTAGPGAFEAVLPELDALVERQNRRFGENVSSIVASRQRQQAMLAERRHGAELPPRRVTPELEPWFQRTRRLKAGDVVTFKAGSDDPDPRTLAWMSDDRETFVFTDRSGRQTTSVAQQELALELLRGSARVLDSPDVPAMDRGVYQMLHEIHRTLAEEGRRDSVTGLMPLSAFMTRVEVAIGRAQRRGSKHALLVLNLDGFAAINDNCGRNAGDSLLRKLSRLLERQIGQQGCITRSYADEFLILLEDHSFQDARRFAERQCRAIDNSRVVFEGEQYPITASIGLVPVTRAGESAEAVLGDARAALAGAKRRGGNQLRVFDPDEDRAPEADAPDGAAQAPAAPGAGDLGALLDAGRLVLQRQMVAPIVPDSEAKAHYDVLLALRGEDGEVAPVSPDLLMEAERGERMADVDRWVVRTALDWMSANRREVVRSGGFTINLSGATLSDESLLEYVVGALTETSVPPAKVIFEVTESVAIDRLSSAVDFIRTLREYGCRFAIADFGAGHATFSYLKTLPVDFVKIDGLFVHDLAENDNDFAMVKSINEISHLLGKLTIAEYVDSEAVLDRLKELGVDYAQGTMLGERQTMN